MGDRRSIVESVEKETAEGIPGLEKPCFHGALDVYDRLLPAGKSDIFRLAVLYLEGGAYLDMKSVATHMDAFVSAAASKYIVLPMWPGHVEYPSYTTTTPQLMSNVMIWPKRHWIIAEVLQTAIQRSLNYYSKTHKE